VAFSWSICQRRGKDTGEAARVYGARAGGGIQTDHITHMRLKLELHGRTEDIVVHLHQALLITVGIQVLNGVFNGIQTLMLRLLQV